jgi:undecaprenyl-diphosphatase
VGRGFAHPLVTRLDSATDAAAARLRGRAPVDRAMYALSQAGNHSMVWHGINLVDAVVGGPEHRRRALRRSAVLVVEQAVVNGPVKVVFRRARPDHVVDHPHALREPSTSSFPSGHASAGACATVLLSHDLGAGPLWATLAAAVAWSRVHVGAHHGSDIAGGAAIGAALGALAGRVWPPPESSARAGRYREGDARG